MKQSYSKTLAYIIGVAIGDGNLSNPNSRAVRLRITCDKKYPRLIQKILKSIKKVFPENKVSLVKKKENCVDISCYSNKLEQLFGWQANKGSKYKQKVSIPKWIKLNKNYSIECLRGLFETDRSIYNDRGYKMVNFVTVLPKLAIDTKELIKKLGFQPHLYKIGTTRKIRYNLRISKDSEKFIKLIKIKKN